MEQSFVAIIRCNYSLQSCIGVLREQPESEAVERSKGAGAPGRWGFPTHRKYLIEPADNETVGGPKYISNIPIWMQSTQLV